MSKAPDAFRTISEVAEQLDTPPHVLRFWESKFSQVRPVKRAGGRRYYRPADVALLGGIKKLLHEDGLTIRGVKKVLTDKGVRHVAGLAGVDFDDEAGGVGPAGEQDSMDRPQGHEPLPGPAASAEPPCPPAAPPVPAESPAPPRATLQSRQPLPRPLDLSGLAAQLRRIPAGSFAAQRPALELARRRLSELNTRRSESPDQSLPR